MRFTLNINFLAVILFFISANCFAQNISSKDIVDVSAAVSSTNPLTIDIIADVKDGWHINSNSPFDEFLTPTSVTLKDSSAFSKIKILFPPADIVKLEFSETELSLFQERVIIKLILSPKDDFKNSEIKIEGDLFYQPCNDQTCLFPVKKTFSIVHDLK